MLEVADYTALIVPEHAGRPKFVATVAASTAPFAKAGQALQGLVDDFDLDTAVGAQLDVAGEWVGRSRRVPVPLTGLFFTWGDPARGWGRGLWKGPYDAGNSIYELSDDFYRKLLRAKILANAWDGTTPGAQAVLDAYFTDPATSVFVEDDGDGALENRWLTWGDPARGWGAGRWRPANAVQGNLPAVDMAFKVVVSGKHPSILDLALLGAELIAVKPASVRITYAVATVDRTPAFGFGVSNAFIAGWGQGSWTASPDFVITNVPKIAPPRSNTLPAFGFGADDDVIGGWGRGFWALYPDLAVYDPALT